MCSCVHVFLSGASLNNQPTPHFNTHNLTYTHTYTHTRGYFRSLAPDGVSRSINYISAPAIKQGYYQAAAHRPGKARPIKGCCDVGAGTRSCDSNTEWQLMLSRDRRMERRKDRQLRLNSKGENKKIIKKENRRKGWRQERKYVCKSAISSNLSSP